MSSARRLLAPALVWALVAPAAAGTPEPADWAALGRPLKPQSEPPLARPDPILMPAPGAPALVCWGETWAATIRLPTGAAPGRPEDWRAWLTTRTRGPLDEPVGQPVELRFALPVIGVAPGPRPDLARLQLTTPATPPRETYHMEVQGPGGLFGQRVHAVRLLGACRDELRLAVIADHQLRDPTSELGGADRNNGTYPRRGRTAAESMLLQEVDELALRDPDLVLHLGDLVFGTDYREELAATLRAWWRRPLASYMVPGNHDGMALYALRLKQGWWARALRSVRCARHVLDGEVTAWKVFELLRCLYGDLKEMLFEQLHQDGLDYWRRMIGPTDYSFARAGVRFIGLNSYAGSPERRHAFVLGLDWLGVELGVATVDNYGGFVTPQQLGWLEGELDAAERSGQRRWLLLHHDPRGNRSAPWGARYHMHLPFPTEPLGLRPFQEWNYEGNPEWDSDPDDGVSDESQRDNSAVALLRLIARGVDVVLTGHVHDDSDERIARGQQLAAGSGIEARRDIRLVRVTTAASTPKSDRSYWGYRLTTIGPRGSSGLIYAPARGLASVPAGNLWLAGEGVEAGRVIPGAPRDLLYLVHNGLAEPVSGRLRAYLDALPQGWRFVADSAAAGAAVRLVDVGIGPTGRNIYYLEVDLPAAPELAPPAERVPVVRVLARRARDNRVPRVAFTRSVDRPAPGQRVRFDAGPTADPDGDRLLDLRWEFGDGATARGRRVEHRYAAPGRYPVRLTAVDDCGAYARYAAEVVVEPAASCAGSASACAVSAGGLVLFGLLVGLWWWRRFAARSRS